MEFQTAIFYAYLEFYISLPSSYFLANWKNSANKAFHIKAKKCC